MRTWSCLAVALALLCSAARAQLVPLMPDMEGLAAEPGAEVTRRVDGAVGAVTLRRGDVLIQATRPGGRVKIWGEDTSRSGAVLCPWMVYIEVRTGLAACSPGQHADVLTALDEAIGRINGFIVANSLVPTSERALTAAIAARQAAVSAQAAAPDPDLRAEACRSLGVVDSMVAQFRRMSRADWQRSLDDLLRVPRIPVMNPCL